MTSCCGGLHHGRALAGPDARGQHLARPAARSRPSPGTSSSCSSAPACGHRTSSSRSPKASSSRKPPTSPRPSACSATAGIKIALDDFGTGYSSLNYLKRYPVDRIKIDRSFVSQLAPGSVSVAIVQAMVTLAHALKIEVTAEGVETHDQARVLKDLGCNVYQGFLFSAPVTPSGLVALLQQPRSQVA
ncbi:MAG: EAL domain-containing protein [Ferruginibacter sp.]